jgi:hypothetical protein
MHFSKFVAVGFNLATIVQCVPTQTQPLDHAPHLENSQGTPTIERRATITDFFDLTTEDENGDVAYMTAEDQAIVMVAIHNAIAMAQIAQRVQSTDQLYVGLFRDDDNYNDVMSMCYWFNNMHWTHFRNLAVHTQYTNMFQREPIN